MTSSCPKMKRGNLLMFTRPVCCYIVILYALHSFISFFTPSCPHLLPHILRICSIHSLSSLDSQTMSTSTHRMALTGEKLKNTERGIMKMRRMQMGWNILQAVRSENTPWLPVKPESSKKKKGQGWLLCHHNKWVLGYERDFPLLWRVYSPCQCFIEFTE